MPNGHEWAEGRDWSEIEMELFEGMAHDTDALNDGLLQSMFDLAYFDQDVSPEIRQNARNMLEGYEDDAGVWHDGYLMDEYGFDFNEYFDWDAWREAYAET